ncbi:MAG: hypothetical protein ABR584_05990 [Candidatus Baltobacteraceae bacterium]
MTRVVAHLIVGAKPEPFLPAMLASIEPVVERIFVNENSGLLSDAPNLAALESSKLAREGRMSVSRTVFTTFSAARNHCFELDSDADADTWINFIDADEVHGEGFKEIARKLERLPSSVGFVDGFSYHFFKSFDWYASIERRMLFHRWTPQAHWEGAVHERLAGVPGKRVALPQVHAHYGWAGNSFYADALKCAQYAQLGARSDSLTFAEAHAADHLRDYRGVERFFANCLRRCIRFAGEHPVAAFPTILEEKARNAEFFADMEGIILRHQTPLQRVKNAMMSFNYEQRWRARVFQAALYGML